jgi:hypothetical protein
VGPSKALAKFATFDAVTGLENIKFITSVEEITWKLTEIYI